MCATIYSCAFLCASAHPPLLTHHPPTELLILSTYHRFYPSTATSVRGRMEAACGESDAALHCCDVVDAGMATEARQHFVKVALNRVRVWVSAFVRVRAWLRPRLCMYACVCSDWRRGCVRACMRVCVRACVRACSQGPVHAGHSHRIPFPNQPAVRAQPHMRSRHGTRWMGDSVRGTARRGMACGAAWRVARHGVWRGMACGAAWRGTTWHTGR